MSSSIKLKPSNRRRWRILSRQTPEAFLRRCAESAAGKPPRKDSSLAQDAKVEVWVKGGNSTLNERSERLLRRRFEWGISLTLEPELTSELIAWQLQTVSDRALRKASAKPMRPELNWRPSVPTYSVPEGTLRTR